VLRRRLIGIATIVVGVLAIVVVVTKPNPFADRQTIWAEFDNVNGLGAIDRDIRVAGVNEGEIGEVKRVGDDALVELKVSDEIAVHTDARLALRPHTLFEGSAFIDLHPGSPSAPLISEGTTIPARQTRVYVSFDDALRTLQAPTRRGLRELIATASKALAVGAAENVQRTLRATPELTRELGPTARALQGSEGVELARAIRASSDTVAELARREDSLIPLAQRANATLAALDVDSAGPLDRALAALPGPLETLRDRGAVVTALIDRGRELAVDLHPALVDLAPALEELQPLLIKATPAIRRAVPLVHSIGTVLQRATDAAPAFERLLRTLRPAGPILGNRVLPALTRDSQLGIPTYLQLISAFTGGDAALSPYQTAAQGTLGTGHMIRLGAYFDPGGGSRLGNALPCEAIAQINPALTTVLAAGGFCK
jgi:ABC-type transporter Mla subunit MlaD